MGFKFKKGSKVEVRNKRVKPSGSWFCAEIVSGKGRYYCVRYDPYPSDIGASVVRVRRKAIRPCPPVGTMETWVPGNIVEVFDNCSWKSAEVASVIGGNYYLVKLFGSFKEFRVHSSELRWQQYWQDGTWINEKDLEVVEDCNDEVMSRLSKEGSHSPTKNDTGFKEPSWDRARGTKRMAHVCSPLVETCTEAGKLRAVEKEGKGRRLVARRATKLPEKGHCWRLGKLASIGPRC